MLPPAAPNSQTHLRENCNACTSHVNASIHQAATARKLPILPDYDEINHYSSYRYYTIIFLSLQTVAAFLSKGVTTLPHNYHAGRLRHNATKQRACNLDTPHQNFTGTTALDSRQLPPQNSGSVELNHAATTYTRSVWLCLVG